MGKKNKEKEKFESTVSSIERSIPFFAGVSNAEQLDRTFEDKFTTKEQKLRDKEITRLLQHYVTTYQNKSKTSPKYKLAIMIGCGVTLGLFTLAFLYVFIKFAGSVSKVQIEGVVALITVSITYLTLFVGTLNIITKYVFPQKEEEYITNIVKMIQQNDLKNKKENIKSISDNEKNSF